MRERLILFFFATLLLISPGHCMIEEVDFNGTAMVSAVGKRITDDSMAQGIKGYKTTVSWLCGELKEEQYKKVKSLNLSKNCILDEGAKQLAEFFEQGFLPHLKVLDLSFNRISDQGIIHFSSLLKRKDFEHLIIYGNNGAATSEGITNLGAVLTEEFNITDHKDIRKYLAKVIWIPENWLDSVERKRDIPSYYAQAHREYYHPKD